MLLNASVLNSVTLNSGEGGSGGGGGGGGFGGVVSGRFVNGLDVDLITSSVQYRVFARVKIADPSGVMQDYATRGDIDWLHSVEYAGDIESPVATATVKLRRENKEGGNKSLSPFRTDSAYNTMPFVEADATFGTGPSIDAGRRITIEAAALPASQPLPADEDWHLVFDGTVDSVDWAKNPIVVEARDKCAALIDTWFPQPNEVAAGSFSLDTLNTQQLLIGLLDLLHLDIATTLNVPILPDPEVLVTSFRYDIEPGIDALLRVSQINGWDLRQRFNDFTQQFELTYKDPGRAKEGPDFAFYPSAYIDVSTMKVDRIGIRNDVGIHYGPEGDRHFTSGYSPESVRRYGRRSMVLVEATDSPIQTEADANFMIQLILFDLAEPIAEKAIEMPYAWFIELHNLIRFPTNGVHSDTTLDLSVISYKHVLDGDKSRTYLATRGKQAGLSYWHWLGRRPVSANPGAPDGTQPGNGFGTLSQTPDYATDHVQFDWAWNGDPTATFDIYVQIGSGGFVLADSTAASVFTLDYDIGSGIEPFDPENPEVPIYLTFYVVASVGGAVAAQSPPCYAAYAFETE